MVPEARDMEPSMLMSIPSSCATAAEGRPKRKTKRVAAVANEDMGVSKDQGNWKETKVGRPIRYYHASTVRIGHMWVSLAHWKRTEVKKPQKRDQFSEVAGGPLTLAQIDVACVKVPASVLASTISTDHMTIDHSWLIL